MKNKLITLPNILTLANLACGCAAISYAFFGHLRGAFWLIVAAAVFDFLDGMAARLTGQYSEIGKQLDSLADVVSFGVAPSVVLFTLFRASGTLWDEWLYAGIAGCLVFSVALFSALRLAKFNVDETQKDEFEGLPTPAAALAIAAMGWMAHHGEYYPEPTMPGEFFVAVAILTSALLICPLRMFSLKFKGFGWRNNELRYTFLAASAVLIAVCGIGGVAACIGLYIVVSALRHVTGMRHTGKK